MSGDWGFNQDHQDNHPLSPFSSGVRPDFTNRRRNGSQNVPSTNPFYDPSTSGPSQISPFASRSQPTPVQSSLPPLLSPPPPPPRPWFGFREAKHYVNSAASLAFGFPLPGSGTPNPYLPTSRYHDIMVIGRNFMISPAVFVNPEAEAARVAGLLLDFTMSTGEANDKLYLAQHIWADWNALCTLCRSGTTSGQQYDTFVKLVLDFYYQATVDSLPLGPLGTQLSESDLGPMNARVFRKEIAEAERRSEQRQGGQGDVDWQACELAWGDDASLL